MSENEEVLGTDDGFWGTTTYCFTDRQVWLWNGEKVEGNFLSGHRSSGYKWTYDVLRNGSVSDSDIRSRLRHLPNAQNVINAVLEIKNY